MATLGTDRGLNAFFRRETAHEMHHKTFGTSLGKEKIRCDLVDWIFDPEKKDDLQIISNQFCIAMEEDHFVNQEESEKKTGWFRVAVRVAGKDSKTYQYAIFNLASLSKRLEVSEDELKRMEKSETGIDAAYIKEKLEAQITKQKQMLEDIHTYESKPLSRDSEAMLKKIEPFINEEFPEDRVLQKKFSEWHSNRKLAENPKYQKAKIDEIGDQIFLSICKEVKSKLWVASTNDPHIEKAINNTNPLEGAYWATNGKGKEKSLHLRRLSENEDPSGKYSIDIKPFVYSSCPTLTSAKEVPLKLPNEKGWVLANVQSLKWLDLTEDRIRELARLSAAGVEGMSQLDVAIKNKLAQISQEIKEGRGIKQQLADAHPNPIHPSMRDQKERASKLINDLYDNITAPDANKRQVTLEAFQKKCEETIKGSVDSENAIVSVFLLGAHDCDDRKLRIVWNSLMDLIKEKLSKLPDRAQFNKISNLDLLKLITSLDTINLGQKLKEKCHALNLPRDEVDAIQFLNKDPGFTNAARAFVGSILQNIERRKLQQESNSFNVRTFTNLMNYAQNAPGNVAMKAAIFSAAGICSDRELGIIAEWLMSNDFEEWIAEQSEYISQGPSAAQILMRFKLGIENL